MTHLSDSVKTSATGTIIDNYIMQKIQATASLCSREKVESLEKYPNCLLGRYLRDEVRLISGGR